MDNNIKVNVDVNSNGTTDRETKAAKALKAAYDDAGASASRIKAGGTGGSRAVAERAQPVGAQLQQRNIERGASEQTGASARDFANQAQGLGGLVRLYATYAANVFAVGAAFRALSTAMDTTNMIRGLNQIGAASGVALGALSKELANTTGGAISLREAMSATVKVTAAGLGSENVLRLGQVAAKASQALGVDMSDAISRLSRGITKLEPELLDELGIFTKIEPAVQKYALNVGKAASQLTDFERRQAFANAVLEEGEKKFAAIKVDANPYNKLSATFQNLAQSGLELVNKILAPIASFLSSSPTALLSIITLFGVRLLKNVIPAISEFKTSLETAATKSTEQLKQRVAEAEGIRKKAGEIANKNLNIQLEREIDAVNQAEQKMQSLRAKRKFSSVKSPEAKAAIATLQDPALDPTSQRAIQAINVAQQEAIRLSTLRTKGAQEESRAISDIATGTKRWGDGTKALSDGTAKLNAETQRLSNSLVSVLGINTRLAQNAEKRAIRDNIVQTAAYNASVVGLGTSLSILRDEIDKENITGFARSALLARGAVAALTGAVNALFSAISRIFVYVGIIVAVYEALQLLYSFMSKNQKEQKAFSESVDKSTSRLEAFGRTVDYINKLPFAEQINTESTDAKAKAINELSTSMSELIKTFEDQKRAAGAIDTYVERVKGFLGLSTKAEEFSETLGKNLFAGLKEAGNSKEAKEAKEAISGVLEIDFDASSEKQVIDAIKRISDNGGKLKQVEGYYKSLNTQLSISASRSVELKTSTEELDKAYKTFFNSLKSTDSFDILADKQKAFGIKLLQSLADPARALTDLVQLLNKPESAQFFSQQSFSQLLEAKTRLEGINEEQARNNALIKDSENAYRKAAQEVSDLKEKSKQMQDEEALARRAPGGSAATRQQILETGRAGPDTRPAPLTSFIQAAEARAAKIRKDLEDAQKTLDESKANGVKAARDFALTALSAFERGSNITGTKIEAALSKGANIVTDNLIGALGDLPGVAALRAQNEKRQLESQASLIRGQLSLINATQQNTLAREKATAVEQKRLLVTSMQNEGIPEEKYKSQVDALDGTINAISKLQDTISRGPRAAQQVIQTGIRGARTDITKATEVKGSENVTAEQIFNATQKIAGATEQIKIFDQAQEFIESQAALYGQLNEIAQKTLSIKDIERIGELREQEKVLQSIYDGQLRGAQVGLEELQTQESLSGYLTEQQRLKRDQLQIDAIVLQQAKEISQTLSEINVQEFALKRLREEQAKAGAGAANTEAGKKRIADITKAEEELARRRQDLNKKGEETASKINQQQQKSLIDRQRDQKDRFDFDNKAAIAIEQNLTQQNLLRLDAAELEYNRLSALEGFSKVILIDRKAQIDSERVIQQQQLALLDVESKRREINFQIQQLKDRTAQTGADTTEAQRRLESESASLETQKSLITAKNSLQLKSIEQARQLSQEQERYNELLSGANFIANELGSVFGDLGKSIGDVAKSVANFSVNSEKGSKALIDAEKKLADARANAEIDPGANLDDIKKQEKEVGKLRAKNTAQELSDMASIAGATKGFFKEKTLAYKVMQRTEQALHLASMAMQIKAMLLDKTSLASKLVSNATGMASDIGASVAAGVKAVANSLASLPFPANIAAGAAMAAVVAALLSKVGKSFGGSGGGAPAITAEQKQGVQGSAMAYNTSSSSMTVTENGQQREVRPGEQYQFGRGALGDPTAKSEVVAKSIEILTDVQVDNYTVNLDMLRALYKIEAGIRGVAAGIFTIPGLAKGSLFGTTEGGSSSKILGGLFGSSTSRKIIDSGLKVSGSLEELSKNSLQLVSVFERVETTRKSSFFGLSRGGSSVSTQTRTLEEEATPQARRFAKVLNKTFTGAIDFLESAAEESGIGREAARVIIAGLGDIPAELQEFSARGLKPDEVGPAFQAWLGSINDFYANAVFGTLFDSFAQAGEEITTTVVRVITQNKQATQAFKNLGFGDITQQIAQLPENVGISAVKLQVAVGTYTQNLIDLAGGTEKFFESLKFIEEKFVPEPRREAVRQASARETISTELSKRGLTAEEIGGIKTRDDYLNSLNAAQRAAQQGLAGAAELFDTLRGLAPAFDVVLPPLEQSVASAEKVKDEVKDLTKQSKKLSTELERLSATDYARSLGGISDSFTEAIDNLAKAGTLTTETFNIQVAISEAQKAILDAQNSAKAAQIIETLNKEVAGKSLGPLSKEIDSIKNKARDYANQLINLDQATDENIKGVREWEAALMESARAATLNAQEIQYADLFSGSKVASLTLKFKALGLQLPSSVKGFQQLIDSVDTTTDAGIDLRASLLGLGSEFNSLIEQVSNSLRSAYQARVEEIKGARDQFKGIVDSLKDFRLSLLTGAQSPLTPAERYQTTKSEFERLAELASRGDVGAIQKLQGASTAFLDASRSMYSSSEQYTQDFKQVLSVVDSTQSFAELQVEIAQNTLLELEKAVGSLIDITNIGLDTKAVILTGLGENLTTALDDYKAVTTAGQDAFNASVIENTNAENRLNATTQSGVTLATANNASNVRAIQTLQTEIEKGRLRSVEADNERARQSTTELNTNVNTAVDRLIASLPKAPPPAPPPPPPPAATDAGYYGGFTAGDAGYGSAGGVAGVAAKGMAFDMGGVRKFARGGVVSNPMFFTSQDGLGLMGEAGPEAIMPLSRTRNGDLGITASLNTNNDALLREIARLNQKVETLTQVVADGAVINAQATNRNTEAITETISETGKDVQYMKKVKNRTSIV